MSFDAQELSPYGGQPIELFLFRDSDGQTVTALTTGADLFVDGLINFLPGIINRSSIRQTTEEPTGSLQIRVPNDSTLAQQFKAYLPTKPIALVVYRYHANDALLERRVLFIGQVVSVSFEGEGIATLNCEPVTKAKGKKVPWQVYKKGCNWAVYEHGCGILREPFETLALTYSISGNTITATPLGTHPDDWFPNGYVYAQSTGERRFIIGQTGSTVMLDYPFFNLQPGEPLVFVAGCPRTEVACKDKFDNLPNYLGFDYIPEENPYDTNFGPSGPPKPETILIPTRFGQVEVPTGG